jgi:predicted O-methyltransferase YrrM
MSVALDGLRLGTLRATPPGISYELLEAMPELVVHPGPNPLQPANYYQDRELDGAICATAEEAMALYWASWYCQPTLALEIGSYVGWTAAHIAAAMETGGTLICVDDLTESGDGPAQLMRLNCNLTRAGVANRVRVVPGHSPEILQFAVGELLDLAFIDGCHHGQQPLLDVQAVAALMAPDGVIAMHDTWMPDVMRACDWLGDEGWAELLLPTPARLAFYYRERPAWWMSFEEQVLR